MDVEDGDNFVGLLVFSLAVRVNSAHAERSHHSGIAFMALPPPHTGPSILGSGCPVQTIR